MTNAAKKQTPAEAYAEHRRDIAAMLDWFEMALGSREEAAKAEPQSRALVGDLAEVRWQIKETLAFLSGHDEAQIEEALAELRM